MIVVKDNVASNVFIVDKSDCSIVRNEDLYKAAFARADLSIVFEKRFEHMPKDYYTVMTYALR